MNIGDTYTLDGDEIRVIRITEDTVVIEREMDYEKFLRLAAASIRNGAVLTRKTETEFEV